MNDLKTKNFNASHRSQESSHSHKKMNNHSGSAKSVNNGDPNVQINSVNGGSSLPPQKYQPQPGTFINEQSTSMSAGYTEENFPSIRARHENFIRNRGFNRRGKRGRNKW